MSYRSKDSKGKLQEAEINHDDKKKKTNGEVSKSNLSSREGKLKPILISTTPGVVLKSYFVNIKECYYGICSS